MPRPEPPPTTGAPWRWIRGTAPGAAPRPGALASLVWPPRPRHAAALLAAAVAALGLGGMGFQGGLRGRLPADLDWRAAAAVLERDARPGDAVALSPWWAERARLVLPPGLPVLSLPRYAGEDLLGVKRIWLLALPGAPGAGEAVARDLAARAGGGEPAQRIGAFALSRWDLATPALPISFLPDRLAGATVTVAGEPCPAAGPLAFACGPTRVARQVREVGGGPRACIAVRAEGSDPVEIRIPGVPSARLLRAHAGLVASGARVPGPVVRVAVRAGPGEEAEVEISGPGWRGFDVDTALDAPSARDVELVVSPPGPGREICVDAAVLP